MTHDNGAYDKRTVTLTCSVAYKDWQVDALTEQFVDALKSTLRRWSEVTINTLEIGGPMTHTPDNVPRAYRLIRMGDGDWQIRFGYVLIGRVAGRWMATRNVNAR